MGKWRRNATVWVDDPEKGRVLVGAFGFAWWTARKVHVCRFDQPETQLVSAFNSFRHWDESRSFWRKSTTSGDIHRFVKTGLWPPA